MPSIQSNPATITDARPFTLARRLLHRWSVLIFGISALIVLLLAGALSLRAAHRGRHVPIHLSLHDWFERPQTEGTAFVTDGPVTIKGMTEATFTPRLPSQLHATATNGRYLLAAFVTPDGDHRLLLAPEAQVAALPHLPLAGVTVRSETIGVPAEALAELRHVLPNIDTAFVTGLGWTWTDAIAR